MVLRCGHDEPPRRHHFPVPLRRLQFLLMEGWHFAVPPALLALVFGVAFAAAAADSTEARRNHDNYRQRVEICATTADTPPEFRACVKASR